MGAGSDKETMARRGWGKRGGGPNSGAESVGGGARREQGRVRGALGLWSNEAVGP